MQHAGDLLGAEAALLQETHLAAALAKVAGQPGTEFLLAHLAQPGLPVFIK